MKKQQLSSITIPKSTIDLWFKWFFNIERNKRSTPLDITQKRLIREFISFLRKNNVFYQYFRSFIVRHSYEKSQTPPHVYKNAGELFISNAFIWVSTCEGDSFWYKLHLQWLDLYDKNFKLYKKSI